MLVLEPPPAPPAEGVGDTRGFLLAGLPSSPGVPFLLALAGRFFDFATKKPRQFKKLFQHWEHETDREQLEQHPKC